MASVGITVGVGYDGQLFTNQNPCGETALPTSGKKVITSAIGEIQDVTTCLECGCPDLIEYHPEYWTCVNCGFSHQSAVLVTFETAEKRRPVEHIGLIDAMMSMQAMIRT